MGERDFHFLDRRIEMRWKTLLPMLLLPLMATSNLSAQSRGKARTVVNGQRLTVDYGRPVLRDRDMLSMAFPGMVWRLGMDQATEIESEGNLVIADKTITPGRYSLWAKKVGESEWTLGFHPKTGIWGQPELRSGYVAELPLKLETVTESAERLTIKLSEVCNRAVIDIEWGTSRLRGSFGVH